LKRPLNMPHLPAAMAAQGKHGILSGGRDYRDAPVLAYAAPVTGTSWLMVAEIDEAEAYAGIHTLAWAVAVITCIGLLLLYATGYQSWRREREQKELLALRAIQAAEARFRVVFEQAPLGLVLFDAGLPRIAEANQRFADIVGRPLSRLIGLDPHQITHPDDIHSSGEMAAALNAGELADYHQIKRYLRPDGSVVWISETCAPLHVSPDEAPRRIAIIEDITERKEMEERLQISESRHRLLADNAIDVISTLDVNGRFSYVSPSVFATRGYTPDEVKQQALRDALSPASAAVIYEYFTDLKACIEEGRSLKSFRGELEYKCKDGSMIWCDATASPLLDSDGNFIEVLGVTRDISERRRYEDELRHVYDAAEAANAAKSEFLAHMSHEIRTPMNAVLGLAQVLERETLAPNQRDMVLRIRGAGQSLLTILNDVLDLSKIEAGQLRIEPRAFDLHSLLAKLDSLMGQTAHSKGVSLRIAPLPAGLGALLGDGLRLEQVLFNLTSNAIKFTEQGEVAITVTVCSSDADGLRLRFEVRDTGIGIASDGLAQLFTPFTQADAGISRRYGGTGLGLSICKRLLDLMGGVIGANSQPGLGSTFWFELPFDHAETHSQMPSGTATEPALPLGPRLNGAHILVVDDSAMNRDLVERALQIEGATSTLAADGQQAIQLLKNRPDAFAAVLMDVQMPVMDGLSATRMIRDELGLKDLPIIAFTAGVGVEQQAAARLAGADDILAKPMDLDQMALLLQQWITPPAAEVEVGAEAAKQGKSTAPSVTHASETSSQRAATARGDETFPAIVGIDHERVMRRLGGDREMFVSLVQMFFEDNSQAVSLTRQELAAGDTEAASRRMHTLASNAGFICAMEIMESARQLEQAIDRGDETEIALVVLEQLIANLLSASTEIRNLAA
jgi:PAS domain S-box-containing protein